LTQNVNGKDMDIVPTLGVERGCVGDQPQNARFFIQRDRSPVSGRTCVECGGKEKRDTALVLADGQGWDFQDALLSP
jgi:hypothetical protein